MNILTFKFRTDERFDPVDTGSEKIGHNVDNEIKLCYILCMSHLLPHEALAEYEDGRLTWAEILTSYPFLIPTILKLCGDTEQLTSDTRDRTWGTLQ